MKRSIQVTLAAIAAAISFAQPAKAQVLFTGYTNGCFYITAGAACVPETANSNVVDAFGPLTYRNSTFSGISSFGFLGIGANPSSTTNIDNLGSFLLTAGTQSFVGESFVLRVSFTAPGGVVPPSTLFTANLAGNVVANPVDAGGYSLIFTNPAQVFTYPEGSFTLNVNNIAGLGVATGSSDKLVALTGSIVVNAGPGQQSVVPEPSTYLLLASGLAGIGIIARRRRAV